jgi:hypothetical protein
MILVPGVSTIDALVRLNRDKFSVRVSTDGDIRGVEGGTPFGGDVMRNWKAVTFIDHVNGTQHVHVVGVVDDVLIITHPVIAMSRSRCSIQTEGNRVYVLTDPVSGEPPEIVYKIAFALRAWGHDLRFGLGVPMLFA